MIKRIKINNVFRNIPSMDGIILSCVVMGKIEVGDKIILEKNMELLISAIEEPKIIGNETNLIINQQTLNNFSGSINLQTKIGRFFLVVNSDADCDNILSE
jgi:hypothetical protein